MIQGGGRTRILGQSPRLRHPHSFSLLHHLHTTNREMAERWRPAVIQVLRRLTGDRHKLEASLGYIVRPRLSRRNKEVKGSGNREGGRKERQEVKVE